MKIELAHSRREWTTFTISGALTAEELDTLNTTDTMEALELARHLDRAGRLSEESTTVDDAHDPFSDGEPNVVSFDDDEPDDGSTPAERYAAGLQAVYDASRYATLGDQFFAQKPGRKFTRIVCATTTQAFVHAFVENVTGEVYKAEGWRSPAKGARFATVEDALAAMGGYVNTGYLYR